MATPSPAKIPFRQVLDALLDADTPLNPRFLYRFSDLDRSETAELQKTWPDVPVWRRQALMEDIEQLGESDYLLSFDAIARLAVNDSDPTVRLPAVRTLWEYEEPDLVPIFIKLLETDADAGVRAVAATGLGRFVYLGEIEDLPSQTLQQIEELLIRTVRSGDDILVRRRALESLGYSGRDEIPDLIENAYNSGNKEWIASALFAMGRSANKRWEPQIMEMLDNHLPTIRLEAARAAGELEISRARPHLLELIDDPDVDVREATIWSLSQLGGEGVREALEQLYETTEDEEETEYLESALDNLAFTEDLQLMPLIELSEDEEQDEDGLEDLEELDDELFDDFEADDEGEVD